MGRAFVELVVIASGQIDSAHASATDLLDHTPGAESGDGEIFRLEQSGVFQRFGDSVLVFARARPIKENTTLVRTQHRRFQEETLNAIPVLIYGHNDQRSV
jgi:hypothetical protein